ncbi:hypothetical protein HBI56_143530 [Parastagonospora nodorum]|uniref:Uncharacterized protein n=1 Tax=Phaeosphaeria nodorum (strain SN15 / ATCC MYA-4574 / FGSC 10173) TaxID=321614 RepID=A0A7U2I3A1_PHANO|nr:hypothetical protein HBH56_033520 [Parastagonospora nodorum]QRD00230.1 hypothetical protein JI435_414830 [Parastagonospora nodorum SN15]KAH3933514.1 hypothetical protein HBH54_065910 [Parastagonospora nodorum]KAH3952737.1 hypothetical protein HBH53_044130 [Parastagonospora nodorum]KAH3979527.1 hypothetical protein HBH51_055160 [Parastagonospora nodorum]
MSLRLDPSLVSRGSAALVSAAAAAAAEDEDADSDSVNGGAAANAGGDSSPGAWHALLRCSSVSRAGK